MLWFFLPWCYAGGCFSLLVPGLWAGPCTSSQLPCRGSSRILLCWFPSCARDVGVYCSFVGLVLLWFGFGLCPGCGLFLVHCFSRFDVFTIAGCGLRLI